MRVTGSTSSSAQSVIFEALDQLVTSTDNGDLLAIGNQWNQAEFNIFQRSARKLRSIQIPAFQVRE